MPKETFGGGDDSGGGGAEERKKPSLDRFGLGPDVNIRDLFWKLMASYAATRKPKEDLQALAHDRFALMRVALSTLASPGSAHFGPAPRFIALFSAMMFLDAGWEDAFMQFLAEGYGSGPEARKELSAAMKRLAQNKAYADMLAGCFSTMLRGREQGATALFYVAAAGSAELSRALRKELVIFARGDIGENQQNAIKAITLIKDDADVKKSLVVLLSHWDAGARLAAAKALETMKNDPDVRAAVASRLGSETDQQVKRILSRIMA
jgi:hypothetical protein